MTGTERGDQDTFETVLGAGEPQRVGRFRFLLAGERWEWSPAVARMHGYPDGEVTPTTELMLSHKHPDDRERVAKVLERVAEGEPYSSRHRIVDTNGHTRWVIVVGDQLRDDDGNVLGTSGFYVDVTKSVQSDVSSAIAELAESRAEIEQAKGILMLMYGIDAERAFEVLTWRSQETNVKVRELSSRLLEAVCQWEIAEASRREFDHILLQLT